MSFEVRIKDASCSKLNANYSLSESDSAVFWERFTTSFVLAHDILESSCRSAEISNIIVCAIAQALVA